MTHELIFKILTTNVIIFLVAYNTLKGSMTVERPIKESQFFNDPKPSAKGAIPPAKIIMAEPGPSATEVFFDPSGRTKAIAYRVALMSAAHMPILAIMFVWV